MNERPDLRLEELLELVVSSKLADVWTSLPGTVTAYDAPTQRASVEISVKNFVAGEDDKPVFESFPLLNNVLVMWPAGGALGGWFMHAPLQKGDPVLLVFTTLDASAWEETGKLSNPTWIERHSLQSVFAIPMGRGTLSPQADAAQIKADMLLLGVSSFQFVALANLVDARLAQIQAKFDAHTHVVTGTLTPPTAVAGTAAAPASPIGALASVAATKVKAQ